MNFPFVLAKDREFDVIGFGTNAVDFLIQVTEYPAFNTKVELTDYVQAAGGEIATAMAGLQRLGLRTSYIGRFGDDQAGEFGMLSLRDEGVDLSMTEIVSDARTQIAFIIIDRRNGERTVIWQRDAKLAYGKSEAPADAAVRAKVLHCTPHDAYACIAMARQAKQSGTIVSIDLDNVFDGLPELLPMVDIIITSAELPNRLFGISDKKTALLELKARYGAPLVGLTLGEKGSILLCGDKFTETPGFAVPNGCKDTTGAGDSFRAGLIYGMIKGESIEESARMANAVAALKCREIGARTALPTKAELTALLKAA